MRIIIAGAGAVGTHLANLLSREKHDIVLVDQDETRLEEPSRHFDLLTINVSATSIDGLREAGASSCDLLIAVTSDESTVKLWFTFSDLTVTLDTPHIVF